MTSVTSSAAVARRAADARGSAWKGLLATLDNEIKGFYRQPQALAFTLAQPFILLLILNTFNFHVTLPNGETRPYLDRLLPGLMAFSGMNVGLNSIIFSIVDDRERGVLRRVRATPLPTASYLGGVIVSRVVITAFVAFITYASGVWIFGAEVSGSLPLLIGLTLLGSVVFIAVGLVMVSFAKSDDDVAPMFMLVLMPSILFSGAFLDRGGLPDWLHWITNGLPLTFLTDAVQQVANLNRGFGDITTDIIGLVTWGVIATGFAIWKFRMA
jgi:ABC-2 type transport system permease protein